jgi:hypothetical protein
MFVALGMSKGLSDFNRSFGPGGDPYYGETNFPKAFINKRLMVIRFVSLFFALNETN